MENVDWKSAFLSLKKREESIAVGRREGKGSLVFDVVTLADILDLE